MAVSAPWSPSLAERQPVIDRLTAAVRATKSGRGGLLTVEAEAGCGKTRVLGFAAALGEQTGMTVLRGRAMPMERETPYGMVRQLIDPVLAADSPEASAVRMTGPASAAAIALGWGAHVGSSMGPSVEDPTFAVRYGLVALTVELARQAPLMLVVDDAQWCDASSLRYLLLLVARAGLPVMIVVGYRPPHANARQHLVQLASAPCAEALTVGPLGIESLAPILSDALGEPAQSELVEAVYEATGGNPFLVVEVARMLMSRSTQSPAARIGLVREQVPGAVAWAVLLRLGGAESARRRVAEGLAILGDGCPLATLAAFTGIDPPAAAAASDDLRRVSILDSGATLSFAHPLIGAAVRAEIPPGARDVAHGRAADLLSSQGRPAIVVARHLIRVEPAGNEGAAQVLEAAARVSLEQGAPETAVVYARRALAETRDHGRRADLHELLLAATVDAADVDGLAPIGDDPVYEEIVATIMADPQRLRRRASNLCTWLLGVGRVTEATELIDQAVATGVQAGDLRGAVEMEAQLVVLAQLPPPRGAARLERYRGGLPEGSREHRLILGLDAWWASLLGRSAAEAASLARRALNDNADIADDLCAAPLQLATLVLARADDLDGARATAEVIVRIADERRSVAAQVTGRYLRGYVAHRRGDLSAAETDVRFAIDLALERGLSLVIPLMSALLTNVLVDRGELDEAERVFDRGVGPGVAAGGYWYGPVRLARGRLSLAQGRAPAAAAELGDLAHQMSDWSISGYSGVPVGALRAQALMALGDHAAALTSAQDDLDRARRWGAPSVVAEAMVGLGIVVGGEDGVALLRAAAEDAEKSPAQLVHGAALIELGALLRRERRSSDARGPLLEGLAIARRCGATRLARAAAYELEASGGRPVRHATIGADALTPSERRVAEMAARGMTNREIATTRFVSIKTVESHLRAAYDKLGIGTRKELKEVLTADGSSPT